MFNPQTKLILFIAFLAALVLRHTGSINRVEADADQSFRPILINKVDGSYSMIGLASWYSRNSPGINELTANNEIFNDHLMTCAIWGVIFNSRVKVTNLENGRWVILRVNDRGPDERYSLQGRVIDMTQTAFEKLSDKENGLIHVKVELL